MSKSAKSKKNEIRPFRKVSDRLICGTVMAHPNLRGDKWKKTVGLFGDKLVLESEENGETLMLEAGGLVMVAVQGHFSDVEKCRLIVMSAKSNIGKSYLAA